MLGRAAGLRWLHISNTGLDGFPLQQVIERDIILTNGAGLNAEAIADHAIAGMLAARRGLHRLLRAQAERRWAPKETGDSEIRGAKVLVHGYGTIGRAVAERARALGMGVTAVRRHPDGLPGLVGPGEWRQHLGAADFVVLAAPLTAETRRMIGADELRAMRPDAWLVNVSRGGLTDETALVEALREGRIGGAVIDAFVQEPLPAEHPLWELPNVILSPHSSSRSRERPGRASELFAANLRRYLDGEPLLNLTDPRLGY